MNKVLKIVLFYCQEILLALQLNRNIIDLESNQWGKNKPVKGETASLRLSLKPLQAMVAQYRRITQCIRLSSYKA